MKKSFRNLLIAFTLFWGFTANSQEVNSNWINAVGGLNSNWIIFQNAYGNPEIEYSTTFGLTGGMGLSYFLTEDWGINATFLATKMGQSYSGVQSGGDADRKVKLTYAEIPFVIMKHIPYTSNPTWFSFGPDIMILLNAQQEYTRKGGDPLPNPEGMKVGDIRERFNKSDVAIQLALNKMYKLEGTDAAMFLLSFQTSFGLTDINKVEWRLPERDGSYEGSHNFYIGIKAGMMFKASRDKKEKGK